MTYFIAVGSYERILFGFDVVFGDEVENGKQIEGKEDEKKVRFNPSTKTAEQNQTQTKLQRLRTRFASAPHESCIKALDSNEDLLVSTSTDQTIK